MKHWPPGYVFGSSLCPIMCSFYFLQFLWDLWHKTCIVGPGSLRGHIWLQKTSTLLSFPDFLVFLFFPLFSQTVIFQFLLYQSGRPLLLTLEMSTSSIKFLIYSSQLYLPSSRAQMNPHACSPQLPGCWSLLEKKHKTVQLDAPAELWFPA